MNHRHCKICHGNGNNGADDAPCLNCGGSGVESADEPVTHPDSVREWEDCIVFKRPTSCVSDFFAKDCDGELHRMMEINITRLLSAHDKEVVEMVEAVKEHEDYSYDEENEEHNEFEETMNLYETMGEAYRDGFNVGVCRAVEAIKSN